jgi:hypothetical protein
MNEETGRLIGLLTDLSMEIEARDDMSLAEAVALIDKSLKYFCDVNGVQREMR